MLPVLYSTDRIRVIKDGEDFHIDVDGYPVATLHAGYTLTAVNVAQIINNALYIAARPK